MCVKPNTGVTNHESLRVVVKDPASPNTEIAITECNHNLPGGDMNACDSNASDLNKPGGPALAMTDATGTAIFPAYKARVSLTKKVGDTFCSPGGDTCFILAANVSTMTQLNVPPAPFTTK
jgi:hypothetical protein